MQTIMTAREGTASKRPPRPSSEVRLCSSRARALATPARRLELRTPVGFKITSMRKEAELRIFSRQLSKDSWCGSYRHQGSWRVRMPCLGPCASSRGRRNRHPTWLCASDEADSCAVVRLVEVPGLGIVCPVDWRQRTRTKMGSGQL